MRNILNKILWLLFLTIHMHGSFSNFIELSYVISKVSQYDISIRLTFAGSKTGKSVLMLPNQWAGHEELYNNIYDLRIIEPYTSKIINTDEPYYKTINNKPNEKITIEYKVKQAFKGKPQKTNQALTPIIQQDYFQIIGNGFLIAPKYDNETKVSVSFTWDLPSNWKIANSYGLNDKVQNNIKTTIGDLFHSIFLGGDFKVIHKNIGDNKLWLAFKQDNWENISSNSLLEASWGIVQSQRNFWNDYSQKYFLISVIPVGTYPNSFQGVGLHNSFALFLPTEINFDSGIGLLTMISHEYFHTWNNPSLFNTNNTDNDAKVSWFTEGLTDYYANRILLKAGLISLEKYVQDYNSTLIRYYTSPVIHYTNEQIGKKYWKNYDVSKLPYLQGNILAHNWNAMIKDSTNNKSSFDDLMKELINSRSKQYTQNELLSVEKIIQVSKKYLQLGLRADIENYIEKGQLIKPTQNSLGPCCKLVIKKTARYKSGFPIKHDLKKGYVTYVHKGSAAEKAGLRVGYKIISVDYDEQNIHKSIIVKVYDGNSYRTISYMPYSQGEIKNIPQFVLDQKKFTSSPELCLNWF